MTKTAYLRVYGPDSVGSGEPVPAFVREYGLLSEDDGDTNRVVEWKGRHMLCPSNLRLRVLESTVAFANAYRGMGAGLVPEEAAARADTELRLYHRANPGHRSHVLTSAWHVPVRWFVVFDPSEKEVYEGPGGAQIRYRTDIEKARHRGRHALGVLEALGLFVGPAQELEQLLEWLEPFSDQSMVELDYGDVSGLFDPNDLVFDDTCELVQQSVGALESGDMLLAGQCYGQVVTRWAPAFSVTFSN